MTNSRDVLHRAARCARHHRDEVTLEAVLCEAPSQRARIARRRASRSARPRATVSQAGRADRRARPLSPEHQRPFDARCCPRHRASCLIEGRDRSPPTRRTARESARSLRVLRPRRTRSASAELERPPFAMAPTITIRNTAPNDDGAPRTPQRRSRRAARRAERREKRVTSTIAENQIDHRLPRSGRASAWLRRPSSSKVASPAGMLAPVRWRGPGPPSSGTTGRRRTRGRGRSKASA